MVAEAKQRVAHILGELENAVSDLHETEASAYKAAESAQIAQSNAAAAGLAVASASAKGTQSGASGYYHH
ncbi:hypothetical protein NQ314_013222 [Rhamnusium bicolor]|uniref:Uncharacterized protein n=1 Tax=Rhamnusium bicolor TaxID=1586634 RepID=A0AAV8X7N0_9CUCU|nr:hypothetical protein NQ314_013222 [Rhamnusium bicolor]